MQMPHTPCPNAILTTQDDQDYQDVVIADPLGAPPPDRVAGLPGRQLVRWIGLGKSPNDAAEGYLTAVRGSGHAYADVWVMNEMTYNDLHAVEHPKALCRDQWTGGRGCGGVLHTDAVHYLHLHLHAMQCVWCLAAGVRGRMLCLPGSADTGPVSMGVQRS